MTVFGGVWFLMRAKQRMIAAARHRIAVSHSHCPEVCFAKLAAFESPEYDDLAFAPTVKGKMHAIPDGLAGDHWQPARVTV